MKHQIILIVYMLTIKASITTDDNLKCFNYHFSKVIKDILGEFCLADNSQEMSTSLNTHVFTLKNNKIFDCPLLHLPHMAL